VLCVIPCLYSCTFRSQGICPRVNLFASFLTELFLLFFTSLVPRQKYCESIHQTRRRKTRTVMVGNVPLGSDHPIRVQTMTTSDTKDVARTVEEVMRIADKGADIVRITVQGKKEADACFDIKNTLVQKNYNIPLVADIHFAPTVALRVAECFDKIRVNPGNFADRRAQFEQLEYTDDDYQKELEHIEKVEFFSLP
jgi:(E)-4-hydroxy-3-methylbut-2-enyl-diphosphate synthase